MDIEFKTLNNNNDLTFNQLLGINNEDKIAGYFGSGAQGAPNKGYTLSGDYDQDDYKNENFPGSVQTQVTGINDHNVTVGFWADSNNANLVNNNFGFVDQNGVFTNVVDPLGKNAAAGNMTVEQLLGVNDHNEAAGFWTDSAGNDHGFTYNINSKTFSEVDIRGFASTTVSAVNNEGVIAGFVSNDGNQTFDGFIRQGNNIELLTRPKGATSLQVLGINDEDQVVGSFTDASGTHGFLFDEKSQKYTTINDPHGVNNTVLNGINDKGQAVGFYVDSVGNTDGLLVQLSGHHS
jgi:hypothetical protein